MTAGDTPAVAGYVAGGGIFRRSPHEAADSLEAAMVESYALLLPDLSPPFPLAVPSPARYCHLNRALLFALLTAAADGNGGGGGGVVWKVHLTHLHAAVTDGYSYFVSLLLHISSHAFPYLLPLSKFRLLSLAAVLIDVAAVGIDNLIINLLRQAKGGDFGEENLWFCFELLKLLFQSWEWVESEPEILAAGLFVFLRLASDHYVLPGNTHEQLKNMEVEFCVRVLRSSFAHCLRLGRDLIRLLQDVVCITEFRAVWKELLSEPAKILQLYKTRTPSRYFSLRLSPQVETQLRFMLSRVKWGYQKRYQLWFATRYLSATENQSIIPDLIRFICCAHHPSNEILQSDVISRWAVVGWLLKSCVKNHVEARAKLALFYDWMFFGEGVDKIMNIEPAVLLIVHSVPKNMEITNGLLEFLFLLVDNYDLGCKDLLANGVRTSFRLLLEKGVVGSYEPLVAALSPPLRSRFLMFLPQLKGRQLLAPVQALPCVKQISDGRMLACQDEAKVNGEIIESVQDADIQVSCSGKVDKVLEDFRREIQFSCKRALSTLERMLCIIAETGAELQNGVGVEGCSLSPDALADLVNNVLSSNACEIFSHGIQSKAESKWATCLIIRSAIFSKNEKILDMTLCWSKKGRPVGVWFLWYAASLADEAHTISGLGHSESYKNLLSSLEEGNQIDSEDFTPEENSLLKCHINMFINRDKGRICNKDDSLPISYEFVEQLLEDAFLFYKKFLEVCAVHTLPSPSRSCNSNSTVVFDLLISDVEICHGWKLGRPRLLFSSVFRYLSSLSTGNQDFIQMCMKLLDPTELVAIQIELGLKRFSMFTDNLDTICHLVQGSFLWDAAQQHKFWMLLVSELSASKVQVGKLVSYACSAISEPSANPAVVGGLLTLLRSLRPTLELVCVVMALPNGHANFSASVLASWFISNSSLLSDTLGDWLKLIDKTTCDGICAPALKRFVTFLDSKDIAVDDNTSLVKSKMSSMVKKLCFG